MAVLVVIFISNRFEFSIKRKRFVSEETEEKIMNFYNSIHFSEWKVYSQYGEDGVILKLVDLVGIPRRNGTYVEYVTFYAKNIFLFIKYDK